MRIRTIKPGFFTHEKLADLSPLIRLFFISLWCAADRRGRLADRPRRLKIECLPYDDCDVEAMLQSLEVSGFISRYTAEGVAVIQVEAFEKHQRINGKEAQCESELPGKPPGSDRDLPGEAIGKHPGSTRGIFDFDAESHFSRGSNGEAPGKHPGAQEGKGREQEGKGESSAREILKIWNSAAAGTAMTSVPESYQNVNKVSRFLGSYPEAFDDFRDAAEFVKDDDFFQGRGRTHFVAHLDYLLKDGKAGELAARQRAKQSARPRVFLLPPEAP